MSLIAALQSHLSWARRTNNPNPDGFCGICAQLDFDLLFNSPSEDCHDECFKRTAKSPVVELGTWKSITKNGTTCAVCAFLLDAWVHDSDIDKSIDRYDRVVLERLRAVHSNDSSYGWQEKLGLTDQMTHLSYDIRKDAAVFPSCRQLKAYDKNGRVTKGPIVAFTPAAGSKYKLSRAFRVFSRKECDGFINFDVLKSWLRVCDENHPDCHKKSSNTHISGLKVIEVETRQIVKLEEGDRFVALSYVWTQAVSRSQTSTDAEYRTFETVAGPAELRLPETLPQMIEDSITIVSSLGEKYLWIDKYCIDQSKLDEVEYFVERMDQIYEKASFTICLALPLGWNKSGVAGVSSAMPTIDQTFRTCEIGTFTTITTLNWDSELANSLWNRRGWTLQEGALSERSLCFAESQVSMICQSDIFQTIFDHERSTGDFYGQPAIYNSERTSKLPWLLPRRVRRPGPPEYSLSDYNDLVALFSRRQLTYSKDVLAAISGILNRMQRLGGGTFVSALPVDHFHDMLLWKANPERLIQRRPGFPSWSWIGWEAEVHYDYWFDEYWARPGRNQLHLPRPGRPAGWGTTDDNLGQSLAQLKDKAKLLTVLTEQPHLTVLPSIFIQSEIATFRIQAAYPQSEYTDPRSQIWYVLRGAKPLPKIQGHLGMQETLKTSREYDAQNPNASYEKRRHMREVAQAMIFNTNLEKHPYEILVLPQEVSHAYRQLSEWQRGIELLSIQRFSGPASYSGKAEHNFINSLLNTYPWDTTPGIGGFGNIVSTIAIIRESPGVNVRVGTVSLNYEDWQLARPFETLVEIF